MSDETVDIEIEGIVRESGKRTLVETKDGTQVWLPTSELSFDEYTMTIPAWLARNEGLIEDDDKKDSL